MNVEPIVPQITAYGFVFVSDLCAQDRIMYQLQLETDGDLAVGQQQENWPT